jgi:hypothetical protein
MFGTNLSELALGRGETRMTFVSVRRVSVLSFSLKIVQRRDANGPGNLNAIMVQFEVTSYMRVLAHFLRIAIIQTEDATPTHKKVSSF